MTNKKKRSSERGLQKRTRPAARKSDADVAARRLTADKLRKSENRYRSLFENMINGFAFHKIVLDKKGKPVDYVFLEVNNSFERLTGLKGQDIIGRRVTDVLPGIEKDPADWIGAYGRVALTGKDIRFEQYAAPIGRWYSVAAYSPMKNYFVTFFEDITEHKLSEERTKHLASFPQLNPNPVLEIDSSGRITYINPAIEKILKGLGMGKNDANVFLPNDFEDILRELKKNPKSAFRREALIQDRVFSLTVHFAPQFNVARIYAYDNTERRHAEDAAFRVKEEWERTFNSVPDLIAILDRGHRIVRANRAFAARLGTSTDKCVGLKCFTCVHGSPEPPASCPHTSSMKDGREHSAELHEDRLGGDFLVTTTPILDENGVMTGSIHVARDISERKRSEDKLRRTLDELQQRQSEVSALLEASRAVMEQHEFRDTAQLIFNSCKKIIGATAGYVALLSRDGSENEVLFLDAGGLPCTVDPSLPMPVRGLRAVVYNSGRTVYENNFPLSEWVKFMPDGHAALGNVMFAPLLIGEETVGILGLANKEGGFTDSDARLASAFGELASIALYNSRLFDTLRESEKRLNRSQEIAHLGSWELDLINNRLYWSDEVYRIFGLQPQEFGASYEAFLEAVHPDDRSAVDEAYSGSLRESRYTYEIEHRVVRKSTGEVRIVYEKCEHIRDESGRIIRSVGMVHDITERKQAEEALLFAYARYRSFISVTGQIGWTTNPAGEVVEDLPEWRNYTGQGIDDIKGWGWSKALHPDDLAYTAEAWRKSVREKSTYEIEYRIRRHDGVYRHFLARGTPVLREDGTILEWVGICIDITERKRAEEEREQLLIELKRSNEELEQFAYIASHDLQEPLRTVSSYVQLISRRYKDKLDDDANEFMNYAVNGATHMQTLLNDLLAYSRIGGSGSHYELTNLNSALTEATANLKTAIESCKAVIEHEGLPIIYLDKVQMIQVFQNLISNAIKFRKDEAPRIHVSADRKENEWLISVSDDGIGINPDYFDRIFNIFKRLHSREKFDGTGIGLAICKKIVERHGGRIWVESQLGEGSTFYFTIPDKSYNI